MSKVAGTSARVVVASSKSSTRSAAAPSVVTTAVPRGVENWFEAVESGHAPKAQGHHDAFYRALIEAVRSQDPVLPPVPVLSAKDSQSPGGPLKIAMYVAHPDDEAGFAGGTLRKLSRNGHTVEAVILTNGEGGRVVERGPKGDVVERRDYPVDQVVQWRHQEVADAAKSLHIESTILFSPEPMMDFGWTTSTSRTFQRWDAEQPGGLYGILCAMVADIRTRKPDVIVTLAPENSKDHGHHKSAGVLTDLAARLAADPAFPGGTPHVVKELVTVAPPRDSADFEVAVDKEDRREAMRSYRTQFLEEMLHGHEWEADKDRFNVRWRAGSQSGSLLEQASR
jgi:LmbE family N-acetylglucosaminyl deacetylase